MQARKHLFFDGPLATSTTVKPPHALARRMARVLRLRAGAEVALFNGREGLFAARVLTDKADTLEVVARLSPLRTPVPKVLLSALLKREAMDRVLRQATELGATEIIPLVTDHAVPDRLNMERARALLVEAAEQCERLDLPELRSPVALKTAVAGFGGHVFWARERQEWQMDMQSQAPLEDNCGFFGWPSRAAEAGDGFLLGPEGGFSEAEMTWLSRQEHVTAVGLGAHILRADTAAVVGLGLMGTKLSQA